MINEEIYAKLNLGKRGRDRGKGVSPCITSLYGSFSEEKNKANEGKGKGSQWEKMKYLLERWKV